MVRWRPGWGITPWRPFRELEEMERRFGDIFGRPFLPAVWRRFPLEEMGWAILYQDSVTGGLFNQWINEHEVGHFAGCIPILVMDVFEHAFITDYGLKRADYIEAFFKNINWGVAESRPK